MTRITDDSAEDMGMLVDHWLTDLKAAGFDDEALRRVSSTLGQCAAASWQYGEEDLQHGQVLQQFVGWTRQQGVVLSWLEESTPPAN